MNIENKNTIRIKENLNRSIKQWIDGANMEQLELSVMLNDNPIPEGDEARYTRNLFETRLRSLDVRAKTLQDVLSMINDIFTETKE